MAPGKGFRVSVTPDQTIKDHLLRLQRSNSSAFNILMRVAEEDEEDSSADDVGSGRQSKKKRVLVFKVPLVTQISWVISLSEVRGEVDDNEGGYRFLMSELLDSSEVKKPIYINITATEPEVGPELKL